MAMKNFLIILFLGSNLFAQSAFENANEKYRKGAFEEAAKQYEQIIASGQESCDLYYNLGNAYYKLNKVAPSIYNYEKALLLNPNEKDIKNNLEFAQKMRIDEIKEMPKAGFRNMIHGVTSTVHYDTWAWLSIGISVLAFAFFVLYYFTVQELRKRIFFGGIFISITLLVITFCIAFFERTIYRSEQPAIVFASVAAVRSEPNPESAETFVLHEGSKVYVLETLDKWKKVQLADGNEGWIEAGEIKEIKK